MLQTIKYPRLVGRAITHDHNFQFRMGAGFPGDVSRTQSLTSESNKQHPTTPVLGYGYGVLLDPATASVRQIVVGDVALLDIYGIFIRFYPGQSQAPGNTDFAAQPLGFPIRPLVNQPCDILRRGYIMVRVNGNCRKGDPVFVWAAADAPPHYQGSFEAAATAGSTIAIAPGHTTFGSGPDAYGNAELAFNI
jgi:hypothetical protein